MSIPRGKEKNLKISSRVSEAKTEPSSVENKNDLVEDPDNARDMRLERRLKRRCVANQSLKINSCTRGTKRTPQDAPTKVILLDDDYRIKKTPQAVAIKDILLDDDYKVYLDTLGNNRCNPSVGDDDLDPQYKMFWENVREDATSFVLEVAVDEDIHILLKYEEDDRLGDEGKPGSPDNLRTVTKRENMENPEISKDVPARKRKTLIDDKLRPDLSKKVSSRVLSSSEPKCKHETEPCDTGIDESYKTFLECIKEDGKYLVFVNKHGKRVKYEEDEESESESEILAADSDPCITSKLFDSSRIKNCNRTGHSQFRDNLMVILKKPYDQLEYEELLQEIIQRKPLERHRDLRGRIKSYSVEICSKSYLDHHTGKLDITYWCGCNCF
ncbi:hypothetical protein CK203_005509 [Vitis vinifera]|uniref:Uncharacterized protein n=1 Tax=Vitis vinifera TaxID=29760 RepID=A0A438K3S9_VITVI|nr:hypothetical protein CK203_005509 [Vitis vinifera]